MPSPKESKKVRADALLLSLDLAPSRAKAQALILAGEVYLGETRIDKPGSLLRADAALAVRTRDKFVSRGGLKLEGALEDLNYDPRGKSAADVGASTGGFTDCLLQYGAAHVFAIDVGHGQLVQKLRDDPRVTVLERVNARHVTPVQLGGGVELCVVDASFIGLAKLLPAIFEFVLPGGHLLALIKPQFEVGAEVASRARGVIRDDDVRQQAIDKTLQEINAGGFFALRDAPCRLKGPKGNLEHFVLAERRPPLDNSSRAQA
jgi:23S rRNA (cytidine1920-2'-O)/16S rRNA (cytidine1409-2'-O)-methyltransferase